MPLLHQRRSITDAWHSLPLHLQLGQHFGDVDGVEGRTGEALLPEVVEQGPDMNERLAVDDEVAVVESLEILSKAFC